MQKPGQATKADFLSVIQSYPFNKKNNYAIPYNHVTFFSLYTSLDYSFLSPFFIIMSSVY